MVFGFEQISFCYGIFSFRPTTKKLKLCALHTRADLSNAAQMLVEYIAETKAIPEMKLFATKNPMSVKRTCQSFIKNTVLRQSFMWRITDFAAVDEISKAANLVMSLAL
jgi:hypothetical protein